MSFVAATAMVQMSLSGTAAALLREMIEAQLQELRHERRRTETRAFKEFLKAREESLAHILKQLAVAAA